MRTHFILFFSLFALEGFAQNYYPPSDPTWQKRTDLSDDFTTGTLDYSGGGVYYLNYSNISSPSWTMLNTGNSWWGTNNANPLGATCVAVYNSNVYAGIPTSGFYQNGGVYNSSGGGAWTNPTMPTPPMTQTVDDNYVTAVAFNNNGTFIYIGTEGGVFYGNNTGYVTVSPPSNSTPYTCWDVTSLAVSGVHAFVGTYGTNGVSGGVELFDGSSWTAVNTGLTNPLVTSLAIISASGISLAAGTNGGGVFYSSNSGTSWTAVNGTGLTNLQITALAVDGSTLIAGTNAGIFYSTNYASVSPTWTSANSSGLTNTYITSIAVISSGVIVAATNGGGVFYSTNYSAVSPTWLAINGTGGGALPSLSASSLAYDAGTSTLYVAICPMWHKFDYDKGGDCCGGNVPSDVVINSSGLTLKDGRTPDVLFPPYWDQGTVQTNNAKYDYGYYEVSAQMPYTASCAGCGTPNPDWSNNGWDKFHPAFWTYYDSRLGNACTFNHQENDIFEQTGYSYYGTTTSAGYWHDDGPGSCTISISNTSRYTPGGNLYSAYHTYGLEIGENRMIYYFDGVPIYEAYNQPDFALEGLFVVQISAGLDVTQNASLWNPEPYAVGDPNPLTGFLNIKYFHYYKLTLNCSTAITCTNDNAGSPGTLKLTGANAYIPAVYSSITIAPSTALSLSSGDNTVFRGVNGITINPAGSGGSFSVPSGETLSLIPNTCDY